MSKNELFWPLFTLRCCNHSRFLCFCLQSAPSYPVMSHHEGSPVKQEAIAKNLVPPSKTSSCLSGSASPETSWEEIFLRISFPNYFSMLQADGLLRFEQNITLRKCFKEMKMLRGLIKTYSSHFICTVYCDTGVLCKTMGLSLFFLCSVK